MMLGTAVVTDLTYVGDRILCGSDRILCGWALSGERVKRRRTGEKERRRGNERRLEKRNFVRLMVIVREGKERTMFFLLFFYF